MPSKNDAWGIEVGANAIKAMRVVRDGDTLTVEDYEVLPFKKILTTPDLDVDEAVQVGLDQLIAKHDFKKSSVVASVPGHMAFARFAKLPPVEPKKVAEIVKFEAVQQIPFPLEQVEWDYQVFQEEDSPEVEVGIFAITKDRVMKFLADYQQVGLRIDALTLSPLGVYNGLAHDLGLDEDSDGHIFVDIGTSSTDVIIVEAGRIWLRTLPIGGNNFTEALVKAFKITFPKAEKLKRDAGTSKYARQIFQAMRPVFADLVQEVQRSLGYYQSLNRDADLKTLVGVGSTFRLPGLTKFLKQQLQMDVRRLDRFSKLQIDGKRESELTSNALNLATVYGLALQGLEMEHVTANILPSHIISERVWKSKQPIFAAAAAVVVAAVGFGQFYLMQNQGSDPRLAAGGQNAVVAKALKLAGDNVRELNELTGDDSRKKVVNFERLGDYRNVWPKMMEDLAYAIDNLQAQEVLMSDEPDYSEISKIPRKQRRRLYVDTYEVEYWPTGKDPKLANLSRKPAGGGFDDGMEDESESESEEEATPLPRFRVTITGFTPYEDANGLCRTFTRALINIDKPGRPYKLDSDSVDVLEAKVVGKDGATQNVDRPGRGNIGRGNRGAIGRGGRGGARGFDEMGLDPSMMLGAGGLLGGGGVGRPRPASRGAGGVQSYADLLPKDPDSFERQSEDVFFKIVWEVELLEPKVARLHEDPNYVAPPPKTEGDEEEGDEADATDAETAKNDDNAQAEDRS